MKTQPEVDAKGLVPHQEQVATAAPRQLGADIAPHRAMEEFNRGAGLFRVHTQMGMLANLMAQAPRTEVLAEEMLEYLWAWQELLLPEMKRAGVDPVNFAIESSS